MLTALAPDAVRAVAAFVRGEFRTVMVFLSSVQSPLRVDVLAGQLAVKLVTRARRAAILDAVRPFTRLSLEHLSDRLGLPGATVRKDLTSLIETASLNARVDAHSGELVARTRDPRAAVQAEASRATEQFVRSSRAVLLQTSLLRAGLSVEAPRRVTSRVAESVTPDDHGGVFAALGLGAIRGMMG